VHRRLLTLWLAALGGVTSAPAQTAATTTDAAGASPAYRSAFDGYRPFSDEKTGSWPQANEAALGAGGWKAYAREAAEAPSQGASAPGSKAGAADPHAGHHKP